MIIARIICGVVTNGHFSEMFWLIAEVGESVTVTEGKYHV